MARKTIDNLAWHNDQLVRDIGSEVDDRSNYEIAESVMEVYTNYDRNIGESKATKHLTKKQAVDAAVLASQIVDWANYGEAYGDYDDPPWGRNGNPSKKPKKAAKKRAKKKAAKKRGKLKKVTTRTTMVRTTTMRTNPSDRGLTQKQVREKLAILQKRSHMKDPQAYLRSTEHYDVSAKGETKADWVQEAASPYGDEPYIVEYNFGDSYTGAAVVVLAGHPDEALQTADEWYCTKAYDGDYDECEEARGRGEGVIGVRHLMDVESNPYHRYAKRDVEMKARGQWTQVSKKRGKKKAAKKNPGKRVSGVRSLVAKALK